MKNRPTVTAWQPPVHIDDYPVGPSYNAGHLTETNSDWRTFTPKIDETKCTGCLTCYILCPDGVIFKKDKVVDIDYDFCKGCGICAFECPVSAITMQKEKTA